MVSLPNKPPTLPVFDREKDGNPFFWIIAKAADVRHKRMVESRNRPMPSIDYLTGKTKTPPADR